MYGPDPDPYSHLKKALKQEGLHDRSSGGELRKARHNCRTYFLNRHIIFPATCI